MKTQDQITEQQSAAADAAPANHGHQADEAKSRDTATWAIHGPPNAEVRTVSLGEVLFARLRGEPISVAATEELVREVEAGNTESLYSLFLACETESVPWNKRWAMICRLKAAAASGVPFALYLKGVGDLSGAKRNRRRAKGITALWSAAAAGVPEAKWELAKELVATQIDESMALAKQAAEMGCEPAVDAVNFINAARDRVVAEAANEVRGPLDAANEDNRLLRQEVEALRRPRDEALAAANGEIQRLRERCSSLEAKVSEQTKQALRDGLVAERDTRVAKAEEASALAQSHLAECEKAAKRAQGRLDDSQRRVTYLEGLLRQHGIAFTPAVMK